MNKSTYKNLAWSPIEAIKVFLKTLYGDLCGNMYSRNWLLRNPNITQKKIFLKDRELTYMVGEDLYDKRKHVPVIFLHGSPGSALCWKKLMLEPEGFQIIAVDRIGYGPVKNGKPDLVHDMIILEALLKDVTKEAEGKAILVGHSLGAGLAARLAADHPDMVRGLALVGGSMDPALEKRFFFQYVFIVPPFCWLLTRSLRNSNRELLQYKKFLTELEPYLHNITCRVAVLHSFDDRLVSYANVEYAKKHFTNAASLNIISFDSAGHFMNRSRTGMLKRALKKYVV